MTKSRPFFLLWFAAAALCSSVIAHAQLQPGNDYIALNPPHPILSNKIEVREFFFYACPHCYDAEPLLAEWLRKLPDDVQFVRTPAVRHTSWEPLAKTFYTLDTLGAVGRLHLAVFDSIHQDGSSLSDETTMIDWAESHGIERKKFSSVYRSAQIKNKVADARLLTLAYPIQEIPSFIIDGRYLVSGAFDGLPATLDRLIEMARKARQVP